MFFIFCLEDEPLLSNICSVTCKNNDNWPIINFVFFLYIQYIFYQIIHYKTVYLNINLHFIITETINLSDGR